MLLTVGEKGCTLRKITNPKRGDTEPANLGADEYDMMLVPNPIEKGGPEWLVLRADPLIGLEQERFAAIEGVSVTQLMFAVIASGGWGALSYADAARNITTRVAVRQGPHSFIRRVNPSGKTSDPAWLVLPNGAGKAESAVLADGAIVAAKPLFPPFLNGKAADGTQLGGPAITALQLIMQCSAHMIASGVRHALPALVVTGVSDDATTAWLKAFQQYLGLEASGNFGPATRVAFRQALNIDVAPLMNYQFIGLTTYADHDGSAKVW